MRWRKKEKHRDKEEADRKNAAADNHTKTYELSLSDLDKRLQSAEQKSDLVDPGKREALNILSDLIELAKAPRTSDG